MRSLAATLDEGEYKLTCFFPKRFQEQKQIFSMQCALADTAGASARRQTPQPLHGIMVSQKMFATSLRAPRDPMKAANKACLKSVTVKQFAEDLRMSKSPSKALA